MRGIASLGVGMGIASLYFGGVGGFLGEEIKVTGELAVFLDFISYDDSKPWRPF